MNFNLTFLNKTEFIIKYKPNFHLQFLFENNKKEIIKGKINFKEKIINLYKERINIAKISFTENIKEKLNTDTKNTKKTLKKYLKFIANGIFVANIFFPAIAIANNVDLKNNIYMDNFVYSIADKKKIMELPKNEKKKLALVAIKNIKINKIIEEKLKIKYEDDNITNKNKELINGIILKHLVKLKKYLTEYFINLYGKEKKEKIEIKIDNIFNNKLKQIEIKFIKSNKKNLQNNILDGGEKNGLKQFTIHVDFLMNNKIFKELKSKQLLDDYIKYIIMSTIIHEIAHGAGNTLNKKFKENFVLSSLKTETVFFISPFDYSFSENIAVDVQKFYDNKFDKLQRYKKITEIMDIFAKHKMINIKKNILLSSQLKDRLTTSEQVLTVLLKMIDNKELNLKEIDNMDGNEFIVLFKNTFEKIYNNKNTNNLFEKNPNKFHAAISRILKLETLRNEENLKKYEKIVHKSIKLKKEFLNNVSDENSYQLFLKSYVLDSVLTRTDELPISKEYLGISLNNNKLLKNIVKNGSLTIFSETINKIRDEIKQTSSITGELNEIMLLIKLFPDKFTYDEIFFVKKLYAENELNKIINRMENVCYIIEDNNNIEIKNIVKSIKKQINYVKKNFKEEFSIDKNSKFLIMYQDNLIKYKKWLSNNNNNKLKKNINNNIKI